MAGMILPIAMAGASGLAGLFSGRPQTQTSTTQSQKEYYDWLSNVLSGNTSQETSGWEAPTYDETQAGARDEILRMLMQRAIGSMDMRGYQAQGLREINANADLQRKALQNLMASRGLGYSPVAANAFGQGEAGRLGQAVQFTNQIPLVQNQLQGQSINDLANFWSKIPTGRMTGGTQYGTSWQAGDQIRRGTESGTSTTTGQESGNRLSGLFSGLGQALAAIYGKQSGRNSMSGSSRNTGGSTLDLSNYFSGFGMK